MNNNPEMYFYYSNLSLLNDILEHRFPPFLKALAPGICIVHVSDGKNIFIDIDKLLENKSLSDISKRVLYELRVKFIIASIIQDKFARIFFNSYNISYIWERINGLAISFNPCFFNKNITTFDCATIDYELLNVKIKDIDFSSFGVDKIYTTVLNILADCINSDIIARVQIKECDKCNMTIIDNNLYEVYWDKPIRHNDDIDCFNINYFALGPEFNIDKETFEKILSYYGLYVLNSHTDEYIRKVLHNTDKLELDCE